ncbi:PRC-barrel domain-containing protein [Roseomonas sp. BN140053]|uniref:PRC-barrel domain-containing protein n=1 Tax=Roseomonas sp. BN140053 TaxID=3391898 RepID=UPI0039EA6E47
MTSRHGLLTMTAIAALLTTPVLAQTSPAPRDGTAGNPPSTATQRAADAVTGNQTPADGTPGNPPGTAVGRAVDRALGTNMSGANPQNSDGTANNPPGTAVGRAVSGATSTSGTSTNGAPASGTAPGNAGSGSTGTSGTSTVNPPSPPASTAAPRAPTTGSVSQPSTLGTSPSLREGTGGTTGSGTGSATGGAAAGTAPNARPMSGTASPDADRASKIIGASVYNDRNESVGSVDDLLFRRGQPPLAVVSVGGFLGIGAKLVTVPFEEMRWNEGESRWQVMGVTRESLTSLPAFSYGDARRG